MENATISRLKGIDAKISMFCIYRDSNSVKYEDNYSIVTDKLEPERRLNTKRLNEYVKVIPSGRFTEEPQDRIKYYKAIASFSKEEKELE